MPDDKDKEPALSPFDKKVQEQTAATAFQLVWGWAKDIGQWGRDKNKIRAATKTYAENYAARHGTVRVLGMSRPMPLHDIYTAVRVVPRDFLGAFVHHDKMEQQFKQSRQQRAFGKNEVKDGIQVANREPFLNLLGAPGAGKSTFLRRLGQEAMLARGESGRIDPTDAALDTKYEHPLLPVLIELREFRTKAVDLVTRIAEEFALANFPEHRGFTETALKKGKLLVLLDGLDEVPDARLSEVINHIRDFVDKHAPAGNRFVTSCRTAHYKGTLQRFTDMVLADFDDAQIERFASNWFADLHHRQAETAKRFVEVLHEPTNAAVLELARTPLLLTFLCLTFAHGELPPTRATLYRRAIDLLLREWTASRRVHDEPVYRELNAELELAMLAEFAAELFREDRFFFTRQRVTDHIARFMQSQLSAPKSLDAVAILEAIEIQQGLIVRRAQDTYSFSHLTIQEYLTAKHIWDEGERSRRTVVQDHLFDERWAVVLELMAGMGRADDLLRTMATTAQRMLKRMYNEKSDMWAVLEWINRFAPRAPAVPHATANLALALALALARTLDRTISHNRAIASIQSLALSKFIDKTIETKITTLVKKSINRIIDN